MNSWDVNRLELEPRAPQILSSTTDSRLIALVIPAGEGLPDHQVHERTWISVVDGEVDITVDGTTVSGGPGLLAELEPSERHAVLAKTDARLILLLSPWPGDGHPGAMSVEDKLTVRERAAALRDGD